MDYPFKRGFKPDIDRIRNVLEEMFPCEIKQENGKLLFSYGAMKSVAVWIENKRLFVVTESATDVPDDVVLDTNNATEIFWRALLATPPNKGCRWQKRGLEGKRGLRVNVSINAQLSFHELFHQLVSALQHVIED